MNRFCSKSRKTHILRRILSAAAVLSISMALFLYGISSVSESADKSYAESLQQALTRSAVHCYAVEGKYPESLNYLCDHYGITWDPHKYTVDYEIIGSNLMPSITVIPLS